MGIRFTFEPYEKMYRGRLSMLMGVLRQNRHPITDSKSTCLAWKKLCAMDISEKRMLPQDGRIKLKLSKTKAIDFRVNSLPTLFGEKLVLRIYFGSIKRYAQDWSIRYEDNQKHLFMEALEKASRNATDYRSNRFW